MTAKYRAAIVGCGDIGHAHVQGYQRNPQVEVVAVVDPLPAAREQYQKEYNIPEGYASLDDLFAATRPDLVSICVWHPLHAPLSIAAAGAGVKGIICEKPMALGMGDADAMLAACERSGSKLMISHQRRYCPGWEGAKELIAAGAIGEVRLATSQNSAGLLNVATHSIDGMRFVLGDPAAEWVMAAVERRTDRYERDTRIEDRCLLLVELTGGSQMLVQSELRSQSGRGGINMRFEGTDGIVECAESYSRVFNADSGGWRDTVRLDWVDAIGGKANGDAVAAMLAWLEGGPEPRTSGRLGRKTTEIMMAAYESARRRRLIHLPLTETAYPLDLMVAEGAFGPTEGEAYDIRGYLQRRDTDEQRYAELRATGMGHREIMFHLDAERR